MPHLPDGAESWVGDGFLWPVTGWITLPSKASNARQLLPGSNPRSLEIIGSSSHGMAVAEVEWELEGI